MPILRLKLIYRECTAGIEPDWLINRFRSGPDSRISTQAVLTRILRWGTTKTAERLRWRGLERILLADQPFSFRSELADFDLR